MREEITTAEGLDALPMGSVVRDRDGDEWTSLGEGVWETQETEPFGSDRIVRKWAPLTLVSRPDAPAPVAEDQEALVGSIQSVFRRVRESDRSISDDALAGYATDAALAWFAARQPAPECRDCGRSDGGCDREVEPGADVTSDWGTWLAEHDAQVVARALQEAAEAAYDEWPGGSGVHCTPEWLHTRADRIERQEES